MRISVTDAFNSADISLCRGTRYTLMLADNAVLHFDLATSKYRFVDRSLLPVALVRTAADSIVPALKEWLLNRAIQVGRSHKDKILKVCGLSGSADLYTLISQYRALSLTDNYWIRRYDENCAYSEVNLHTNPFSKALFPIALTGVGDLSLRDATPELNQRGVMAKAYRREDSGIYIYKTGKSHKIQIECFASRVAEYCGMYSVIYRNVHLGKYDCVKCKVETSPQLNWVPARDFITAGVDAVRLALMTVPQRFYEMRIFDYITGNSDRHNENWSFEVDNSNGILGLSKLYDFDNCFTAAENDPSQIDLKPAHTAALEAFASLGEPDYFRRLEGFLGSSKQRNLADYVMRRVHILKAATYNNKLR